MKQKGFSLIELLVVITILGILAAIGLTSYRTANMKARDSRRAADIQQMRSALEVYRSDTGAYPTTSSACHSTQNGSGACWNLLMTELQSYLSGQTVEDPKNDAFYFYAYNSPDGLTYQISYQSEVDDGLDVTFSNP